MRPALTSYWYSSGGAADPYKAPSALSVGFTGGGDPEAGDDQQSISVTGPGRRIRLHSR